MVKMWTTNFYRSFFKNILLYTNCQKFGQYIRMLYPGADGLFCLNLYLQKSGKNLFFLLFDDLIDDFQSRNCQFGCSMFAQSESSLSNELSKQHERDFRQTASLKKAGRFLRARKPFVAQ